MPMASDSTCPQEVMSHEVTRGTITSRATARTATRRKRGGTKSNAAPIAVYIAYEMPTSSCQAASRLSACIRIASWTAPSVTRLAITCPAAITASMRGVPILRSRTAQASTKAISWYLIPSADRNALAISATAGWWYRLTRFVDAQRSTASGSVVPHRRIAVPVSAMASNEVVPGARRTVSHATVPTVRLRTGDSAIMRDSFPQAAVARS
ncbi:MAG: hypothetical protein JWO57_3887 [Pseudonocardiales bacterium]|nr:hypothetical protein [Pseudonocardiales bacterium]